VVARFAGVLLLLMTITALAAGAAACSDVRIYPLRHGSPDAGMDAGPDVVPDTSPPPPIRCPTSMVGWATVAGENVLTTTGGARGDAVVASTAEELIAYAAFNAPLVIRVRGLLTLTEPVEFTSNKTVYGDPAVPGSGVTGAGLNLTDASNIIVRNLQISKAAAGEGDAITLLRSKHVWIDHCDLSSERTGGNYDGLVDITHASDFITVSWTQFHDHRETSLVGHSADNSVEDTDHLTVTYHHNLFVGVLSGPRIRFGTAHLYNNQFERIDVSGSFAIASESRAQVLVERNLFKLVAQPITTMYMDAIGGLAWDIENRYEQIGANNISLPTTQMPDPPYTYERDSTDTVPVTVPACAGVGKINPLEIED
jgi:pectate lyase